MHLGRREGQNDHQMQIIKWHTGGSGNEGTPKDSGLLWARSPRSIDKHLQIMKSVDLFERTFALRLSNSQDTTVKTQSQYSLKESLNGLSHHPMNLYRTIISWSSIVLLLRRCPDNNPPINWLSLRQKPQVCQPLLSLVTWSSVWLQLCMPFTPSFFMLCMIATMPEEVDYSDIQW